VLLRSTLHNHIARFHFEEVLVIEALKREFSNPRVVHENVGAQSEQAVYDIPVGGHPYLQVNTKGRWLKPRIIVTFYGVDTMPKGRELWKRKN
jgi:hypothetical protein